MTLKISKKLFSTLNKEKVEYVIWKSTISLDESLNGIGDIDLFVKDKKKIIPILNRLNFKKGNPPKERKISNFETYFGLDEESGRIIQLDLYFKIITGKDFLRNYTLPVENQLMKFSIIDKKTKIRIPSKEFELILFILRGYLKENFKTRKLNKDMQKKFNYLFKNSNEKILIETLDSITFIPKNEILETIKLINNNKITPEFFSSTSKKIFQSCKKYSKYNFFQKKIIFNKGRILSLKNKLEKSYSKYGLNKNKKIFIFLGCPGSGKTSTTKALEKWAISSEIKGKRFYLGLSEKPLFERITLYIFIPYNFFYKRLIKIINKKNKLFSPFVYFYDILVSLRWYGASLSKKTLLKKAIKKNKDGYLVIVDRFPHPDVWKNMEQPMEGPTIPFYITFKKSWIIKKFINLEKKTYLEIANSKNVQIFILDVKNKDAIKRGRREIEVIIPNKAIKAIKGPNIIRINDKLNFEDRILDIKKKIWKLI